MLTRLCARAVLFLLAAQSLHFLSIQQTWSADRDSSGRDLLKIHQQKHAQLREQLTKSLERTAAFCEEKGYRDDATRIRHLMQPLDPERLQFEALPDELLPEIRKELPEDEYTWKTQVRKAQQDYSRELYLLAQRLVNQSYASYAFEVIREAAYHDPDNRTVRRVLGFVEHEKRWVTPFTKGMLQKRNVWHERFGWLPKDHVARYENDERFYKGRWMSARQEAELRRDFKNAWEVRTDHFLVKTNHSLERGVEVATAMEEFHDFFEQAFAAFFQSPAQLKKLFTSAAMGTGSAGSGPPHEVHYFADREEYIARLKAKIPQIAITNGLYFTDDRTAYFYHDAAAENESTLFHEATHQLLYEIASKDRPIADKEQFWVIEGIACYMESFKREKGRVSVGNPRYTRFEAARFRYLEDRYYVPLGQFSAMGLKQFQTDPNISKNYSQASGLTHFFMHYDGGKYRDALIEHLSQHYSLQRRLLPNVETLAELTGVPFDELDRQYGEYTRELEKTLTAAEPAEPAN